MAEEEEQPQDEELGEDEDESWKRYLARLDPAVRKAVREEVKAELDEREKRQKPKDEPKEAPKDDKREREPAGPPRRRSPRHWFGPDS